MARHILDLSTLRWRLGPVPRQGFGLPAGGLAAGDDRFRVRTWHPARVPGAVRGDLGAAGLIPPVETPEGISAGDWVDALDWWYETELPGPLDADAIVVLEADGIDDQCAIWLDDQQLAVHTGMFARQAVVLSPAIHRAGPHVLGVRVWGAGGLPRSPDSLWRRLVRHSLQLTGTNTGYFPDRMATPHAQFSFGWDFAPRVFGTGIWDDLRLVTCRGTYIEDVHVIPEPLSAADPTPVRWRLRLALRRFGVPPAVAEVEIAQGEDLHYRTETGLGSNWNATGQPELQVETSPVARWWPWDQGEPQLCRVTVRLLDASRRVLDEVTVTTGVRTVRRDRLADGAPWRFVVNDRPVFLRGANWTPADVLPGTVTPAGYARLLGMAKDAGINFLRIWGGGVRERAAFWQECDRSGIMAWQEFPLACAFLDHYPRTPAYLSGLAAEARSIARALRNHPSLIAWCGGNEINPRRERLPLDTIEKVLIQEDSGRPWIPASPSDGDVHQWDVWHGFASWADLQEQDPPFMSEFGVQALPDVATVAEIFPAGPPPVLTDEGWAARKAQVNKLRHYAGEGIDESITAAIDLTQRVQAAVLQTGIEACRIRREGGDVVTGRRSCGGVAFWQFNEPWRGVTWSVIDRAGRPKAAYTVLKCSYRPLLLAAQFPRRIYQGGDTFEADLWLVNDRASASGRCGAEAWLDERSVWADSVAVPAAGAFRLAVLRIPLPAAPSELILRLLRDGTMIAHNRYDLRTPLPGPRPARSRLFRWFADRLLGGTE